jgi:hypothetical protein
LYPRCVSFAYIILAHVQPAQLARLIRRLEAPGDRFFVHVDAKTDFASFRAGLGEVADWEAVTFVARTKVYWGAFGQLEATLAGLRGALAADAPFDYFVLLTGRDYPIKSLAHIRNFIDDRAGQVFLEARPLPIAEWGEKGGLERLRHPHLRLFTRALRFPGPIRDRFIRYGHIRLPLSRRLPSGLRPYVGSAFWWMPRDCAEYVQRVTEERPDLLRFFRWAFAPEESYFQMLLMSSPYADRVTGDQLRYTEWRPEDWPHGTTLRAGDLPSLAETDKLFASKFDLRRDAQILDLIDEHLLGIGAPS